MSKSRRGFRSINLPSGKWQYLIGKKFVVAFSEDEQKLLAGHDIALGLPWPNIERYRWKCRGSNHRANISPSEIADWIANELRK